MRRSYTNGCSEGIFVAVVSTVEKFPFGALQEGIDAFRQIVLLEQRRAREQAARVAISQGLRGVFVVAGGVMLAFSLHLALFWITVALYQRGWSIAALVGSILIGGGLVAVLFTLIGKRIASRAPLRSMIRRPHELDREDRERTSIREKAA